MEARESRVVYERSHESRVASLESFPWYILIPHSENTFAPETVGHAFILRLAINDFDLTSSASRQQGHQV